MDIYEKKRSIPQNSALHKLCQMVADELNAQGKTQKLVIEMLKDQPEIPWTGPAVKENLWRVFQYAQIGELSTTQMSTMDPTPVHQVMMQWLSENFGIYVDWPSNR